MQGNTRLFGAQRDFDILTSLSLFKYLTAYHVAALHFKKVKPTSAIRKARLRLKTLHDRGKVNRYREDLYQGYVYHIGKRSSHADGCLVRTEFFVNLIRQSKEWQEAETIEIEKSIKLAEGKWFTPDAYCEYKVAIDKTVSFYLENEYTRHDFTPKLDHYHKLSLMGGLSSSNKKILVVVLTTPRRKKTIQSEVEQYGDKRVQYSIISMDDMKANHLCWYHQTLGLADGFMDREVERGRVEVSSKITGKINRQTDPERRAEGHGGTAGQRPGAVASNLPAGLQRPKVSIQGRRD